MAASTNPHNVPSYYSGFTHHVQGYKAVRNVFLQTQCKYLNKVNSPFKVH